MCTSDDTDYVCMSTVWVMGPDEMESLHAVESTDADEGDE